MYTPVFTLGSTGELVQLLPQLAENIQHQDRSVKYRRLNQVERQGRNIAIR